jgi:hypothetical protein
MPETSQYTFSFKEIVTALIKTQNIHDGIWGLFVNFGLQASNVGPNENELRPSALIPILSMGLLRQEKETNLSVDAAKVNPGAKPSKRSTPN